MWGSIPPSTAKRETLNISLLCACVIRLILSDSQQRYLARYDGLAKYVSVAQKQRRTGGHITDCETMVVQIHPLAPAVLTIDIKHVT